MVAQTFNPSTSETEAEAGRCLLVQGLVYRASSRNPGLHRETISKNKQTNKMGGGGRETLYSLGEARRLRY